MHLVNVITWQCGNFLAWCTTKCPLLWLNSACGASFGGSSILLILGIYIFIYVYIYIYLYLYCIYFLYMPFVSSGNVWGDKNLMGYFRLWVKSALQLGDFFRWQLPLHRILCWCQCYSTTVCIARTWSMGFRHRSLTQSWLEQWAGHPDEFVVHPGFTFGQRSTFRSCMQILLLDQQGHSPERCMLPTWKTVFASCPWRDWTGNNHSSLVYKTNKHRFWSMCLRDFNLNKEKPFRPLIS